MILYELEFRLFSDNGDDSEEVLYFQFDDRKKLDDMVATLIVGSHPLSKTQIVITIHPIAR